ncbi:hypothetical protein [Hymenobacter metallicola]|uniref:Phage portal protein n=1 Tax=Hymenobacter metallicola TaxID=2563114 RepID=A0A4Z0Q290_9BACT|nr:hypothetical protein [Hymenobacter metallicola]TGE22832.1 hypothetical protein E5K02_20925 [Hymenobacter metallicola]
MSTAPAASETQPLAPLAQAQRQVIKAQAPLRPEIITLSTPTDYPKWGDDNLYPQRLLSAMAASGTASVCAERKAQFIEGNGFTDQTFYRAVIDRAGGTVDALLQPVGNNTAYLEGWAVRVNINANGFPCEVLHQPKEQVRPYYPDADGVTRWCGLVRNPAAVARRGATYASRSGLQKVPVFNPREKPEERLKRISEWKNEKGELVGLKGYPGEIYYWFQKRTGAYLHPRPLIDAVLDDVYSEPLLKRSRAADLDGRYSAQVMITEFGTATPTQEVLDANQVKYGQFVGPDGSRILLQYADRPETKPAVDTLTAPDASKRYVTDEDAIKGNIREAMQMPGVLLGREIAGKLGSWQEFQDAVAYVQALVVNSAQRSIERGFEAVFRNFQKADGTFPFQQLQDFSIQNLTLEQAAQLAGVSQPASTDGTSAL